MFNILSTFEKNGYPGPGGGVFKVQPAAMMFAEYLAGVKAQTEMVRLFPGEIWFDRFFQAGLIKTRAIV